MNTSFLSKVDRLDNALAYVGVVALALVLAVLVGMALVWPGDGATAYLPHAAHAGDVAAPSSAAAEAQALNTVFSLG